MSIKGSTLKQSLKGFLTRDTRLTALAAGLRLLGLAIRFLFIFFLGREYGLEIAGQYGLIQAIISFSIYVMGLNFSTFSIREFALLDEDNNKIFFASQSAFFVFVYTLVFLLSIPIAVVVGYEIKVAVCIFFLSVLNHISLEVVRILNSLGQFLVAASLLFLKSAGWVVTLIGLHFGDILALNVSNIIGAWMVGELIVVLLCISAAFTSIKPDWQKFDPKWIVDGLKSSVYLLVGMLAMKGLFTVDRFVVSLVMDAEYLGIYVVFMAIANAMTIVTESAYVPVATPKLIRFHKLEYHNNFLQSGFSLFKSVAITSLILAIVFVAFFDSIGRFFDSEVFLRYQHVFFLSVATIFIHNLAISAQIILYAMKEDRLNVGISVTSFIVFILSLALLYSFSERAELWVPIGLFAAAVAGFLLRSFSVVYCWRRLS